MQSSGGGRLVDRWPYLAKWFTLTRVFHQTAEDLRLPFSTAHWHHVLALAIKSTIRGVSCYFAVWARMRPRISWRLLIWGMWRRRADRRLQDRGQPNSKALGWITLIHRCRMSNLIFILMSRTNSYKTITIIFSTENTITQTCHH